MIEQFWDDSVIYSVEYTVLTSNNTVEVQQAIVTSSSLMRKVA